ncbi:MAG: hypothetical protein NW218_21485 [Saprospiraceae bacterium]|nr:hypothetical protein [Saprospiraceae bacterium]
MKIRPYIYLLLLIGACSYPPAPKKIVTTDLKYATYVWYLSPNKEQWDFHLADYLHVDSTGHFELIRHDTFLTRHTYFKGVLTDSIRQIVDSLLLANKFFPGLSTAGIFDTVFLVYDGFTYLLDYKMIDKAQTKIQYFNSSSVIPQNIQYLTDWLNTLISGTAATQTDSFSMGTYLDTLKMISSKDVPPPPGKSVRFVHPRNRYPIK